MDQKAKAAQRPIKNLVIGDGWAALAAAGFLGSAKQEVVWVANSGGRWIPPLPTIDDGQAAAAWASLADRLQIDPGQVQTGNFLREFKHKSFRPSEVNWGDSSMDDLWPGENFVPARSNHPIRFDASIAELDESIRAKVAELPSVFRREAAKADATVIEFRHAASGLATEVVLSSGEVLVAERVIFADRWSLLPSIVGLPKALPFLRGRESVGVLQAVFYHEVPVAPGVREGFYGQLHKDAGEDFSRHVWGHFLADGARSVWSLCLGTDESEDNHEITKKFRRMKQALGKMFESSGVLPEFCSAFMSNIRSEQVRFEESILFSSGEPIQQAMAIPQFSGLFFLTDGYGPGPALNQVASLLGSELGIPRELPTLDADERAPAQAYGIDFLSTGLPESLGSTS